MKIRNLSILIFLFFHLFSYCQNNIALIENEIVSINNNSENYVISEHSWEEIYGLTTENGGIVKVWKENNKIRKVVEEVRGSMSSITRIIYLKDEKPIKGLEIEKIFESNQNAEINYSKQIEVFRINAYVTGFNSIIGEYEFETKVEGKRKLTDYYCELNSLFHILSKLGIE